MELGSSGAAGSSPREQERCRAFTSTPTRVTTHQRRGWYLTPQQRMYRSSQLSSSSWCLHRACRKREWSCGTSEYSTCKHSRVIITFPLRLCTVHSSSHVSKQHTALQRVCTSHSTTQITAQQKTAFWSNDEASQKALSNAEDSGFHAEGLASSVQSLGSCTHLGLSAECISSSAQDLAFCTEGTQNIEEAQCISSSAQDMGFCTEGTHNIEVKASNDRGVDVNTSKRTVSTSNSTVSTSKRKVSTPKSTVSTSKCKVSTSNSTVSTSKRKVSTSNSTVSTSKRKVSTSNSKVSTSKRKVSTLNSKFSTSECEAISLTSKVSALNSKVSTSTAGISTLNSEVITSINNATTRKGKVSTSISKASTHNNKHDVEAGNSGDNPTRKKTGRNSKKKRERTLSSEQKITGQSAVEDSMSDASEVKRINEIKGTEAGANMQLPGANMSLATVGTVNKKRKSRSNATSAKQKEKQAEVDELVEDSEQGSITTTNRVFRLIRIKKLQHRLQTRARDAAGAVGSTEDALAVTIGSTIGNLVGKAHANMKVLAAGSPGLDAGANAAGCTGMDTRGDAAGSTGVDNGGDAAGNTGVDTRGNAAGSTGMDTRGDAAGSTVDIGGGATGCTCVDNRGNTASSTGMDAPGNAAGSTGMDTRGNAAGSAGVDTGGDAVAARSPADGLLHDVPGSTVGDGSTGNNTLLDTSGSTVGDGSIGNSTLLDTLGSTEGRSRGIEDSALLAEHRTAIFEGGAATSAADAFIDWVPVPDGHAPNVQQRAPETVPTLGHGGAQPRLDVYPTATTERVATNLVDAASDALRSEDYPVMCSVTGAGDHANNVTTRGNIVATTEMSSVTTSTDRADADGSGPAGILAQGEAPQAWAESRAHVPSTIPGHAGGVQPVHTSNSQPVFSRTADTSRIESVTDMYAEIEETARATSSQLGHADSGISSHATRSAGGDPVVRAAVSASTSVGAAATSAAATLSRATSAETSTLSRATATSATTLATLTAGISAAVTSSSAPTSLPRATTATSAKIAAIATSATTTTTPASISSSATAVSSSATALSSTAAATSSTAVAATASATTASVAAATPLTNLRASQATSALHVKPRTDSASNSQFLSESSATDHTDTHQRLNPVQRVIRMKELQYQLHSKPHAPDRVRKVPWAVAHSHSHVGIHENDHRIRGRGKKAKRADLVARTLNSGHDGMHDDHQVAGLDEHPVKLKQQVSDGMHYDLRHGARLSAGPLIGRGGEVGSDIEEFIEGDMGHFSEFTDGTVAGKMQDTVRSRRKAVQVSTLKHNMEGSVVLPVQSGTPHNASYTDRFGPPDIAQDTSLTQHMQKLNSVQRLIRKKELQFTLKQRAAGFSPSASVYQHGPATMAASLQVRSQRSQHVDMSMYPAGLLRNTVGSQLQLQHPELLLPLQQRYPSLDIMKLLARSSEHRASKGRAFSRSPSPASRVPARFAQNLPLLLDTLLSLGVSTKQAMHLVSCPRFTRFFQIDSPTSSTVLLSHLPPFAKLLGISTESAVKLVEKQPNLLRRNPASLEENFRGLCKVLGVGTEVVVGLVRRYPPLLELSVERVKEHCEFIAQLLQVTDQQAISMCLRFPPLLGMAPTTIASKHQHFLLLLPFPAIHITTMLISVPTLLGLSTSLVAHKWSSLIVIISRSSNWQKELPKLPAKSLARFFTVADSALSRLRYLLETEHPAFSSHGRPYRFNTLLGMSHQKFVDKFPDYPFWIRFCQSK